MQNKRGQGLSTTAIVLIVLGVVLLVVLIIGFSMGWKNIAPWLSGENVDDIVQQCEIACTTNSVYDYCSKKREIKFDGEITGLTTGDEKNCNELSKFLVLGVGDCPSLCVLENCVADLGGLVKTTAQGCAEDREEADSLETGPSSICCVPEKSCKAKVDANKVECEAITTSQTNCEDNDKCKWA